MSVFTNYASPENSGPLEYFKTTYTSLKSAEYIISGNNVLKVQGDPEDGYVLKVQAGAGTYEDPFLLNWAAEGGEGALVSVPTRNWGAGSGRDVGEEDNVVIGDNAKAFDATANIDRKNCVVVGSSALSTKDDAVAIGYEVNNREDIEDLETGENSVAIGSRAVAQGEDQVVIGFIAVGNAIDDEADPPENGGVIIGANAVGRGVSVGISTSTSEISDICIGANSSCDALGDKNTVVGYKAKLSSEAFRRDQCTIIGSNSQVGSGVLSNIEKAVCVGSNSTVLASKTIAIGEESIVLGVGDIAIGRKAQTNEVGDGNIAIGDKSSAINLGIAIGRSSTAAGPSISIGTVSLAAPNSIGIGHLIATVPNSVVVSTTPLIISSDEVENIVSVGVSCLGTLNSNDLAVVKNVVALGHTITIDAGVAQLDKAVLVGKNIIANGRSNNIALGYGVAIGNAINDAMVVGSGLTNDQTNTSLIGINDEARNHVVRVPYFFRSVRQQTAKAGTEEPFNITATNPTTAEILPIPADIEDENYGGPLLDIPNNRIYLGNLPADNGGSYLINFNAVVSTITLPAIVAYAEFTVFWFDGGDRPVCSSVVVFDASATGRNRTVSMSAVVRVASNAVVRNYVYSTVELYATAGQQITIDDYDISVCRMN